ncbi:hypothetical protein BC830DRAFT_286693 [Chytriomyces sp. MP71]|nr:hypothetical protein BC830DRAFT_286693 [Chytriomyces sp. MP71]
MSEIIAVTFLEAEGSESSERLHSDYKNIFFVSLAAIYACFLVLRLSHQEHPDPKPKTEKQASSKRVQSRQRGANLSQTGKAALIMGWLALILGLGLGLSEEQWTPYRMFGFATGVTMASVVLMEWGHLRKAKRERASL